MEKGKIPPKRECVSLFVKLLKVQLIKPDISAPSTKVSIKKLTLSKRVAVAQALGLQYTLYLCSLGVNT